MSSSTWTKGPCSEKQSQTLWILVEKKKPCCFRLLFITSNYQLDGIKLLRLTVKHVGGGSSFIRTTAAGGTGKTPPGTGCKPGAVGRNTRGYIKDGSFYAVSKCRRESGAETWLQHICKKCTLMLLCIFLNMELHADSRQVRTTYEQGDVAGRGSSDWCQVWGTRVYGQLHPLVQVQRVSPQSLGAALPAWHETHPTNTQ